jgi:hypothetical protein
MTKAIAYVSDEYYAALSDTAMELRGPDHQVTLTRSWPFGAIYAEVPPGQYEVCLNKPGYGSKRPYGRESKAKARDPRSTIVRAPKRVLLDWKLARPDLRRGKQGAPSTYSTQ